MAQPPDGILPFKTSHRHPEVPVWDKLKRKLFFRGELVKLFTSPADSQETILDTFEKLGWPPAIDNPLSGASDDERHQRLERAVRRLKGTQHAPLLAFHVCAGGKMVTWEAIFEKSSLTEVLPAQRDAKD